MFDGYNWMPQLKYIKQIRHIHLKSKKKKTLLIDSELCLGVIFEFENLYVIRLYVTTKYLTINTWQCYNIQSPSRKKKTLIALQN